MIVFTGSRPVGLSIYEQAGQTHAAQHGIKHVIAELGGKNAILVDSVVGEGAHVPAGRTLEGARVPAASAAGAP